MSKSLVDFIATIGLFIFSTNSAAASNYTITFTGILTDGTDTTGVFGSAGESFHGDAFTASFEYNTALGTQAGSTAVFNQLCGGASATMYGCYGDFLPSPVNGSLTINGITKAFLGTDLGLVQTGYPGDIGGGVLGADADDLGDGTFLSASATQVNNLPVDLATTLARTSDISDFNFQIGSRFPVTSGSAIGNPGTVAITAALPEPATWAMMLAGMGIVGLGMRRRVDVRVSYA